MMYTELGQSSEGGEVCRAAVVPKVRCALAEWQLRYIMLGQVCLISAVLWGCKLDIRRLVHRPETTVFTFVSKSLQTR